MNTTELTQNSDPLNTTQPKLFNANILNNSTQPTLTTNQNIQITPQQFVNNI